MALPFSIEQFLAVFRRYNESVWPAPIVLLGLAVIAVRLTVGGRVTSHRWVYGILAALWLWMAVVYHLLFFTTVNSLAFVFGGVFVVQSVAFAVAAARSRRAKPRRRSKVSIGIGWTAIGYALIGYPILGALVGHRYPAAPTFGVPCPTVIFTLGLLVVGRTAPWWLFPIPLAWAVVATSAAATLGMVEDFGLTISAIATLTALWLSRRGRDGAQSERSLEARVASV